MTKGDQYTKEILQKILDDGCLDKKPRPHYEDTYDEQGNVIKEIHYYSEGEIGVWYEYKYTTIIINE